MIAGNKISISSFGKIKFVSSVNMIGSNKSKEYLNDQHTTTTATTKMTLKWNPDTDFHYCLFEYIDFRC